MEKIATSRIYQPVLWGGGRGYISYLQPADGDIFITSTMYLLSRSSHNSAMSQCNNFSSKVEASHSVTHHC